MEKFNGEYKFEQALGIIKVIDKEGCVKFGYFNEKPAILIGFENINEVPEEFIKINISMLKDKYFEIYSYNNLNETSQKLESLLDTYREALSNKAFDRLRIKRIDSSFNTDTFNFEWHCKIVNDEDTYLVYNIPSKNLINEEKEYDEIKLDPVDSVHFKVKRR